ncbi:hypothetical protein AKJ09_07740 [Labilithrix luteola]|uniref:IgGFc-binding protein N-terminal domain-containing protein n=1 Tax=Labilithrix luteola TaxID=1391654 RepID=A0A0K1Q5Y4_9BACT|nr:IgGFc-binding protein [Labilithrix luteola]AKV01077.1 hypothetical protein AKJ09_07740 [Labilithrix luteola]
MTRPGFVLAFVSTCAVVLASFSASCSGTERPFEEPAQNNLLPTEAGTPSPSCDGRRCSRDMKKVIDGCTDDVIEECGVDKGCANGTCVEPCVAAEASKGSVGCSFWTLPPDDTLGAGSCFAAMIANTWDRPVTITADYGTAPLELAGSLFTAEATGAHVSYTKLEGPLPPGQVAVLFLSEVRPAPPIGSFSSCPFGTVGALNADPLVHGTAFTKAFSIKTDAPVSAYSIFPYGGAKTFIPTATLLLPTSSWSTNYVAVSGWPPSFNPVSLEPVGGPSLQIVAMSDDTEVRMRPTKDIYDVDGVTGGGAGRLTTWKLARGEVLQITQSDELTGSPIESNKPVGLFGGATCTFVPESVQACDILQQQIPPLAQWGSEYALVPYHSRLAAAGERREVVPYRLVGAIDGTVLTYDPQRPRDAPSVLRAGEVASFMTDDLVVVKSQDADHPIYASVLMTGAVYNGGYAALTDGDPDFVNIVPTDQFLDRYVFFADFTFPETSLTFVRRRSTKGFMPVELDCVGEVQGFHPLGSSGEYEYAWVDLTKTFAPATGTCAAGRHETKSDGPFSVTVWGTGYAASYGYSGGAGSRPITKVEVPVR